MKPSIVVYGPKACGKTRNAKALARALRLSQVLDDGVEQVPRKSVPTHGALVLTANPEAFAGIRQMPFSEAIKRVLKPALGTVMKP